MSQTQTRAMRGAQTGLGTVAFDGTDLYQHTNRYVDDISQRLEENKAPTGIDGAPAVVLVNKNISTILPVDQKLIDAQGNLQTVRTNGKFDPNNKSIGNVNLYKDGLAVTKFIPKPVLSRSDRAYYARTGIFPAETGEKAIQNALDQIELNNYQYVKPHDSPVDPIIKNQFLLGPDGRRIFVAH